MENTFLYFLNLWTMDFLFWNLTVVWLVRIVWPPVPVKADCGCVWRPEISSMEHRGLIQCYKTRISIKMLFPAKNHNHIIRVGRPECFFLASNRPGPGKIHVTLDWKSLLGIPFALPFCSAVVVKSTGTIYVSGSVGATKGPHGPMIVPGGVEPTGAGFSTMKKTRIGPNTKWRTWMIEQNEQSGLKMVKQACPPCCDGFYHFR